MDKALKYCLIICAVWFATNCTDNPQDSLIIISGQTMGTTYNVKIVDSLDVIKSPELLKTRLDSVLFEVNRQMSTYLPTSEISMFNKSASTDWHEISYDFAFVTNATKQIGIETDGASDLTIGPLVNLWGFGPNYMPQNIPTDEEIDAQRSLIGLDKIHIQLSPPAIKKNQASLYCDLSSTAKGFAVDRIAELVAELGFEHYLVEIGGELRVQGKNHLSQPWKVGISAPNNSGNLQRAIELKNMALATSGDYWNYYEKEGIRYSHLIDSRTGKPISHNLASVTVIHESCMMADGYATAINVMGYEAGVEFAEEKNLPIFMIVREDEGFKAIESKTFKQYFN